MTQFRFEGLAAAEKQATVFGYRGAPLVHRLLWQELRLLLRPRRLRALPVSRTIIAGIWVAFFQE